MTSKVPYKVTTLAEVFKALRLNEDLMFDTETDGLYGSIELAQFYQASWPEVLMVHNPDLYDLKGILVLTNVVMQNASYDISTIQDQDASRFIPPTFDDVLLLGRLQWYMETSFSLDNLMLCALGYDPYLGQDLDKKEMQKFKWAGDISEDAYRYAATDVYYLPQVFNACKDKRADQNYKLDIITLRHCLDMQNNGFPVDETQRMALELRNEFAVDDLAVPVNVNSWKQVRPYIGEEESDGLALARFTLEGNEKADQVNKARKLLKLNSFLKKFDTPTGRIYGKFGPYARSGRLTCKDQNLQQLPRKSKSVFGYKKSGDTVMIYADFSQLELRAACAVTGEANMESIFRAGGDLHAHTKDMMEPLRELDKGRQIGKTCNFNLLYGGGAMVLGNILIKDAGIMLPEKQLYKIKDAWLKLWPDLDKWQKDGIAKWQAGKAKQTPLGRKYMGKLMTDHLNIAIQGGGADVAKLAFHRIMTRIKELNNPDVFVTNFIHDSFHVEAPNDPEVYKIVADIVGESMQSAWQEVSQYFKVKDLPNPVKVLVGFNWGKLELDEPEAIHISHY